jgi:hypothetical protein
VDEAVELYRQGLDIMKGCRSFASDDPVVEVVRTDLAEMLNYLNRYDVNSVLLIILILSI